jgi:hypothetical protein
MVVERAHRSRYNWIIVAGILVLPVLVSWSCQFWLPAWFVWSPSNVTFDAKVWTAHVAGEKDGPRSRMLSDLLTNRLRKGMSREQVRALLGKPDSQSQWDREHDNDGYDLGHVGPFGVDPSVLTIQYDKGGRVLTFEAGET